MDCKLLSYVLLFCVLVVVQSKPILNAKKHLFQLGFLNSLEADDATFNDALRNYQTFFNLPLTGNIDDVMLKNMAKRRCGRPPKLFPSDHRWRKRHLTYKIRNWTEPFTESLLKNVVEKAITLWTQNTVLQITESNTTKSDIDIYFSKQDGKGETLGYASLPQYGDIYFDVEEKWTLNEPGQSEETYFDAVAVHEMGHSLGLNHSNLTTSIMYPFYSSEIFEPTELDKNNLKGLYVTKYNNTILCDNTKIDGLLQTTSKQHILLKGNQYWTFTNEGIQTGPFLLDSIYPGVPTNIDSAFSIKNITYIFKNNTFYRYMSDSNIYIKKLIATGFDNLPSNIDAVFLHSAANVIYFFKGDIFYEFYYKKPAGKRLNFPGKKISNVWVGIPNNIEAATIIDENIVLFIKKFRCYIFYLDSRDVKVKNCRKNFFKCVIQEGY